MGMRLAKGEEKHKIERKAWETRGREQRLSRPSLLSRLNNACYTVLVANEVRRRESRVELPFSRNPGSQMMGKADRKKLRQNRVRAGRDAKVCSLLLACLHDLEHGTG